MWSFWRRVRWEETEGELEKEIDEEKIGEGKWWMKVEKWVWNSQEGRQYDIDKNNQNKKAVR